MRQDLQTYLDDLKKNSPEDLVEIADPVSLDCQMTALTMMLEKQKHKPVLHFKNVQGHDITVVTNLFSEKNRIARNLGFTSESELMKAWPDLSKKRIKPIISKSPSIKRVLLTGEKINLSQFPIPKHFETDAGAYITAGVTIAKDPDTGIGNLSYARLQVKGEDKLGLSLHSRGNLWDIQRRAELQSHPLEVAIVIGMHPSFHVAAATRLPLGDDELELAGGLLGEPIELMDCETVDLAVPAYAEIIIEGKILPEMREDEGPFGEYTGYSTSRSTRHLMQVTAISCRENFIFHDITPGVASEHLNLSKISRVPQFFSALGKTLHNVVDMNYPESGTHYHCYLSMKNILKGQVRQAMSILFGLDIYLKLIIVVDEDIDVYNEQEVLWALATRFQADRDLLLLTGMPCNLLDPSSSEGLSAKLGLDATKKFSEATTTLSFSPETLKDIEGLYQKITN